MDVYFAKQCCVLSFFIWQSVHIWAIGTGHSSIGERRTTFCQNIWDGSEVLLRMCWGTCWKLGKLNGSSLGTWWEHIGSKGDKEKLFQHPPSTQKKNNWGHLNAWYAFSLVASTLYFEKLSVSCFCCQYLAFLRVSVYILTYIVNIYYCYLFILLSIT